MFWIDASSEENAKQSFSTISTIGKVAPNRAAVKSWLSSLGRERPWLLIIDNADEKDFPVEECFPDGDGGTILITTRNPVVKWHGTVGPQYFHFDELGETQAIELLLKAAREPAPWASSSVGHARDIAQALGYLPLALLHAGKTVLAHRCTLETYLEYFEKNWARFRQMKGTPAATPISDANAAIYSSYELIHDSLVARKTQSTEDALDLLKIFSFFHCRGIRLDIFRRAVSYPNLELLEQKRKEQEEASSTIPRPKGTWSQSLRTAIINIYEFFFQLGDRPVLPRLLCGMEESTILDDMRLNEALTELFQLSLVSVSSDSEDYYSMHPAVHLWVRKRPEMTLMEQAVWCEMAAGILSRAILLPPLGDNEEDEIFRRDLVPHVHHVRQVEEAIRGSFAENQQSRKGLWPVLQPRLDRNRAKQLVKFSLVLFQGGLLEEAKELQSSVADVALKNLGVEHATTMDLMLLLSRTYWHMTRGEEAAELQRKVIEACIRVRGKEDLKTLQVMDAYGLSLWQLGRISETREIHEAVVEGYKKLLGEKHVDTLKAKGNLGRAVGKDFQFSEAVDIHFEVFAALRTKLGPRHLDTVIAMDNLAMSYYSRAAFGHGHPGDLDRALELELQAFTVRTEKLGGEHVLTLWSGLNLSRIKAVRGEAEEALAIFLRGHAIARRNLGEDHLGYKLGKVHHGRILVCAKRYEEAEELLSEIVDSAGGPRKQHPDHLLAIVSLIQCRNLMGKPGQTVTLLEDLTEGAKALFGPDHPSARYLTDPRNLSEGPTIILNGPW